MAEHFFRLDNRNQMEIVGVNHVNNFDENEIILDTVLGFLIVTGSDLHITMLNLDHGKVMLEGNVDNLQYKDRSDDLKTKGKSILNRLLK